MAITFSKSLSEVNLLNAYNNNIVEFSSDNVLDSVVCVVTINSIPFTITPINNVFRFNFKEIVSALINTNNFTDAITPALTFGDLTSHVYDDTSNTYFSQSISFGIIFSNGSTEAIVKTYKFIKAVEQFEQYQNGIITGGEPIYVLSPFQSATLNTYNVTYFEGYPFDLSIYLESVGVTNILNQTNGLDIDVTLPNNVNRLFFSDGRTTITLLDYLPLVDGLNALKITRGADIVYVNLTKVDAQDGNMVKWLNESGGWNYWLFNCIHKRERNTKDLGDVNNDFESVSDTTNPFYSIGKDSSDMLTLITERVSENDQMVLNGLMDSPMVYFFTGIRYSQVSANSWLGCKASTKKLAITDYKEKLKNYKLTFDLPKRNTMTL